MPAPRSVKKKRKAEAPEQRPARGKKILARLKREFPGASTALSHDDAFQLLVATILSAQCTDERVNKVTPSLFSRYRTPVDFAAAQPDELESLIRSTGFFRAKARSIIGCSRMLVERFGGIVPRTIEELIQLPGVGRKTANVVLGNHFAIASGVVVDTHVARLATRFGLTVEDDPEKIESDLKGLFPRRSWIDIGNIFILHGRKTCQARTPHCEVCPISDLCPSARP
jgi:endonuclease III